MRHISASILACNILDLKQSLKELDCVDSIHYDVMDGHYVNEISFGAKLCEEIKENSHLPVFVHLMVTALESQVKLFVQCGVHAIAFHPLDIENTKKYLQYIRKSEIRAGLAIANMYELSILEKVEDYVDHVFVLTVPPGRCGQSVDMEMVNNISAVKNMISSDTLLFVDGGVSEQTINMYAQYGVSAFVIGNYLFNGGRIHEKVNILRSK